ncbi:hypothetical protein K1719_004419 [Acacia pycnantha]|nr:hypothetical protein K1719_004419 [Acacia pycnantha]
MATTTTVEEEDEGWWQRDNDGGGGNDGGGSGGGGGGNDECGNDKNEGGGVQNLEGGPNAYVRTVRRIQYLLKQDWHITVSHVYPEGNCCADFLASYVLSLEVGYHPILEPPDGIAGLLREDAEGVGRARLYYNL